MKPVLFIIVAFSFLLQACASTRQPVHVQLKYEPGDNLKIPTSTEEKIINLRIAKIDVSDNRVDKEYLGYTDAPIYGSGISDWVREGILALSKLGYSLPQNDFGVDSSGLSLKVYVNRTSCRGTLMLMRCTVCLEVEYYREKKLILKKDYYGAEMDDRSIWAGTSHFGENSVLKSLNCALDQCLVKMEDDLRKMNQNF
ncbi:MAG: hypothetical protein GY702_15185 [Desulfobulbaceae bacterium]|nr:hypothetical protein [Desulfobulbaceae bacterium]